MRTTSFNGWLVMDAFLWMLFLLFSFGALANHLAIPGFRGGTIAILEGTSAAWTFVAAFLSIWLAQSIRIGMFTLPNPRAITLARAGFLIATIGVVLAYLEWRKYLR